MKKVAVFVIFLSLTVALVGQKTTHAARLINRLSRQAEFIGGDSAMRQFIDSNIHYPMMERDNDIQGRVLVSFIIDTTGALTNIQVVRKVSPGLDKEAMRVIKRMPNWKPARYHNKPVPVYYILPVKFYLL